VPWSLLEQRSEWIFKPKTDLYELLSGIRSLRPAAHDLTDEHKSVLLVVIGHRRKGGVSRTGVEAILGLEAGPYLGREEIVWSIPRQTSNSVGGGPTPEALLPLGLRSYTEVSELKEL
jgi:hypothetical protein